ncbi:MAG: hypothetical protein AAGE84_09575 [Cyanobacteria bacterium P01_G01_bin.39]
MSSLNSEELLKKLESLEQRLTLVEQSLVREDHAWGVINARQVTGSQENTKTIKANVSKSQLVDIYNIVPQILASIAIKVSLTAESYRQTNLDVINLEKTSNGNYWIINASENKIFLVPKDNIKLNIPVMKTVELLFDCQGYQGNNTQDFFLKKPAQVSLAANNQQWKLEELGELDFNTVSPASQIQLELKNAKKERDKIKEQIHNLSQDFVSVQEYIKKQISINELKFEHFTSRITQVSEEQRNLLNLLKLSEIERKEICLQIKESYQAETESPHPTITQEQNQKYTINTNESVKSQTNSKDIPPATTNNWQNPQELFSLVGHTSTVRCLAIANLENDNNQPVIISGSFDNTIKIWHLNQGELIKTLNLTSHVNAIAVTPDGGNFISVGDDGKIQIWNISSNTPHTINAHSNRILAVAVSPDGKTIFSGGRDHSIKSWNYDTGKISRIKEKGKTQDSLIDDYGTVIALDVSSDGKLLAISTGDNIVRLWRLETFESYPTNFQHSDLVWSIAISPDGQTLVCGCRDRSIKLWDISTGKLQHNLTEHSAEVWSVAINPDGNTLASGSGDHHVKLWNLKTGVLISSLDSHFNAVYSIAFSPDGKYLVSTGKDQTIKIWQSHLLTTNLS